MTVRGLIPLIPILSGFHNNRDHRKIIVIDGKVGYTGGINLADEYIGVKKPYGVWKDSAIRIRGKAVSNFTFLFLQMFNLNHKTIESYDKYLKVAAIYDEKDFKGYAHPFGSGPGTYYEEFLAENTFINMINIAKKSIYITTPYLIIDYALTSSLRNASLRGVDVRIVTPHIPDKKIVFGMTRSSYNYLRKAGVKIIEFTPGFIHSKQVLIDDVFAFVGTINMDYRSFVHHYECGVVLYKTSAIADIRKDFDNLFKVGLMVTDKNIKISKITHATNTMLSIFRPLF